MSYRHAEPAVGFTSMQDGSGIEARLAEVGLDAVTAARLAAALTRDRSAGVVGGEDLDLVLAAAVVAAGDPHLVGHALPLLLSEVDRGTDALDRLGQGIHRHLRGLVAWRVAGDVSAATAALDRSLELLDPAEPRAAAYLGRVLDTSGQLLQHRGLLADARQEFERSLGLKEEANDAAGAALTHGNLGRLCMELGDFRAAARHLRRDLDHVAAEAPELTRLRAQLLTQLGVCHGELGEEEEAQRRLTASEHLARAEDDAVGRAYAAVHLGRLALRRADLDAADRRAVEARSMLVELDASSATALTALVLLLEAEVHRERGDRDAALASFAEADAAYAAAPRISPIEHAELLEAWAELSALAGRPRDAAQLLRRALRHLDATTAETMRARIDDRMRTLDESAWLLHSTGRFVGHGQIELLLSRAGQAGFQGREEHVTLLFSDIRRFTSISEGLPPDLLISVLNRYLAAMTRCVEHHGGLVDKFIGDAVMAVFSLPETRADDADRAIAAAVHMQTELRRFNRMLPPGLPRFEAGIGLHAGAVVAGLIGSPQKRSYTVIGDAVNTASRVEGMTKTLGVPLLVTRALVEALEESARWLLQPFGAFRPKGRAGPIDVFSVAGEDDGSPWAQAVAQKIAAARRALEAFRAGRFEKARPDLESLSASSKGYALIAASARAFEQDRPPDDWDGSIELTEK